MSVTNTMDAKKQNNKKKGGIIALLLFGIFMLLLVGITVLKRPDNSFDLTLLENLLDLNYSVESATEVEGLDKFEVVIKTEEQTEDLYELAQEFKSVIEEEEGRSLDVGVHVYSIEKTEPAQESSKEESTDSETASKEEAEDYREYIEVTEVITLTTAIEMGDLMGEAGTTGDWKLHTPIEKGNYQAVTFDFNADEKDLTEEVVFKQLKGIHNVMQKHNESWTSDMTTAIVTDSPIGVYSYTGKFPTKLFVTEEVETVKVVEKN